jgi:hypothetical protein
MPGDLFMLCSDGLHGYLTDEETPMSWARAPRDQLPKKLIALANTRGGKDNITAIVWLRRRAQPEATAEAAAKIDALKAIPLFHHLTYKELTAVLAVSSTAPTRAAGDSSSRATGRRSCSCGARPRGGGEGRRGVSAS